MTYPVGGHVSVVVVAPGVDLVDVLTVAELQERARVVPGDEESDALLTSYITAARQQFERDTGLAIPVQTITITYDRVEATGVYVLPLPPVRTVTGIYYLDSSGFQSPIDPADQLMQLDYGIPARMTFMPGAFAGLPPPASSMALQVTAEVGYARADLPEAIRTAIGILATHYLTAGRDHVVIGERVFDMPAGYRDVVDVYRLESIA